MLRGRNEAVNRDGEHVAGLDQSIGDGHSEVSRHVLRWPLVSIAVEV